MATRKPISDVLRAAIASDGRNVTQIAKAAKVPQPVLHRFVRGERDLTLETADKLAVALSLRLQKVRKGR